MFLWQDTAFLHIENTKCVVTPVACCCQKSFSSKIYCICVYNVTVVSCLVTKTRTLSTEKMLLPNHSIIILTCMLNRAYADTFSGQE
jgi:hypothetical protein